MRLVQAPSKLQDLACFAIIKGIWDRSQLSQVPANNFVVETWGARTYIPHIEKLHKNILLKTQENILKLNLPYNWKLKLCTGVEGLDTEINKFCKELVGELRDCTRENINICCTSIVFNHLTYLDKQSTILNVLYKKDFNNVFNERFLSRNCLGPDSLNVLPDHILKGKQKELSQMFDKLELPNVDDYWEHSYNSFQDLTRDSFLQYSCENDLAFINFYFRFSDAKELEENFENLLKYYLIRQNATFANKKCSSDVLMIFHEYLNEDVWCRILERNFLKIIDILIDSWRHRQHIVPFYRHAANTFLTLEDFKLILEKKFIRQWNAGTCEYNDFMYNIVLRIWNMTPLEYLMDSDVMYRVLPKFVNCEGDFKLFCMMLHVYQQVEMREKMLSQMILYLVARGKHDMWLPILVSEVEQSRVLDEQQYQGCYSSLLDEDALKRFILNFFWEYNLNILYKRVTEFALKSKERVKVFKENLLSDDFVLEYCQRLKYFGTVTWVDDLILWCNEGDKTKLKDFTEKKKKLIHKIVKGLLLDVRFRRLMKNCSQSYFFNKADAIKKELMESSQLRNEIFRSYLFCNDFHLIKTNDPQTKRWIEEFLLMSDEGLQCVIFLITYIGSVDEDLSLQEDFTLRWRCYNRLKRTWLKDNDLDLRLNERLAEYGHPNLKIKEYKLHDTYNLTTDELSAARRVVDVNYRVFRTILHGWDMEYEFRWEYQSKDTLLDLTNLSKDIAREVDLVVDFVD